MGQTKACRKAKLIFCCLFVLLFLLTSCAKEIQLTIVNPAEVDTAGIQKVAVGNFELAGIHYVSKQERNGKWQRSEHHLDKKQRKALGNQIRGRVISALASVPYFDLVYTDEFTALENDADLQDAIAAGGFKTSAVDAVINGRVWLDLIKTDGVDVDKSELEFMEGGGEGSFSYNLEVLVYWPYKSVNGNMALELKMTRLNPTEVVAVTFDSRSYSHMIGGKPKKLDNPIPTSTQNSGAEDSEDSNLVLPNFEQLVSDLAESISAQFIRRVSLTQKSVKYEMAKGGSSIAITLIEAGAYEKAISILTEALNIPGKKNPNDMYNLGLCFEATGDYGLAAVSYSDALKINPDNLLYAQGMGRINRLKRENQRLRQQLSSK